MLSELPAIAITGLKGVGKTESASSMARTVFELDKEQDRLIIENNPERLRDSVPPVLLDEWQRLPEVWDRVRREVDKNWQTGRFLLTGSVSTKDLDIHSGAGRIAGFRMYPLSIEERGIERGTVSIGDMFKMVGFLCRRDFHRGGLQ
jgi:predicted AAA+ superfamily ATPase